MPDFPSPERIIAELNDLRPYIDANDPHPRKGEAAAAEWLVDFANRWSLGDVNKHSMPATARFSPYKIDDKTELANITIDTGHGDDEMLFLHAHYDIISPDAYPTGDISIVQDHLRQHIYRGLGGYDMLGGVAAILTALHGMKVNRRRRVRAILVFGEENDSEGTHAAFDSHNNLFEFDGNKFALSTEISVGKTLKDDYHLIVGRPGRIELKGTIYGKAMHAGGVKPDVVDLLASQRMAKVDTMLLREFPQHLQKHPKDSRGILQGTIATSDHTAKKSGGMSTNPGVDFKINVHYTDPEQGMAQLFPLIRRKIEETLGDDNFELHQPTRTMPWTEPWLEELDSSIHRYPHIIQQFAREAVGTTQNDVDFYGGTGVADENILAKHNIATVCVPAQGEGEHTDEELVNIRSVSDYQVPVIQKAAASPDALDGLE
ncbi:MAG TPA: M20/M25/M40 family metallo-hydrolase [Candidatus Peribacteraceae bacterium]|nr:M20/M25/M40 family metallo-hydrolase [Candidatus Peribacteraceae bacterium]